LESTVVNALHELEGRLLRRLFLLGAILHHLLNRVIIVVPSFQLHSDDVALKIPGFVLVARHLADAQQVLLQVGVIVEPPQRDVLQRGSIDIRLFLTSFNPAEVVFGVVDHPTLRLGSV
jgi:hypothetical protein